MWKSCGPPGKPAACLEANPSTGLTSGHEALQRTAGQNKTCGVLFFHPLILCCCAHTTHTSQVPKYATRGMHSAPRGEPKVNPRMTKPTPFLSRLSCCATRSSPFSEGKETLTILTSFLPHAHPPHHHHITKKKKLPMTISARWML